jgi:hypothetical protein
MLRTIRSLLVLAALMAAVASPGCGDPRPPINQVQVGAIEKSIFAGEWYFQQTVVDSPYSAGFTMDRFARGRQIDEAGYGPYNHLQ